MTVSATYVGDQELPWPEGHHDGPRVYAPHVDYAAGRWTLTGLAKEYALYSAALFRAAGLAFDPVALCWEEAGLPPAEAPFELVLPRPAFGGLGPRAAHALYACPRPHARALFTFLDRVSVTADGVRLDGMRQQLQLVDWPLVQKLTHPPKKLPVVPVAAYGLVADRLAVYWRPSGPAAPYAFTLVRRVLVPNGAAGPKGAPGG